MKTGSQINIFVVKAELFAVSIPDAILERQRKIQLLAVDVRSPLNAFNGCAFHPRCPLVADDCRRQRPELVETRPGHSMACFKADIAQASYGRDRDEI